MMMKIICVFVIIGTVYALPTDDSVNQRDPVQIKITKEEPIPALASSEELSLSSNPLPLGQDLINLSDPDELAKKDENLEPAESFGFGYGRGFGGYRGYGGYGGFGGRRYGWGRGYGGYGGFGYGGRRWGGYW